MIYPRNLSILCLILSLRPNLSTAAPHPTRGYRHHHSRHQQHVPPIIPRAQNHSLMCAKPAASSVGAPIPTLIAPVMKSSPPDKGKIPVLVAPPSIQSHTFNLLLAPPTMKNVGSCNRRPTLTISPVSSTSSSILRPDSVPIMAAYYPDWAQSTLPPENVDFSRFDWVDFAFALPDANFDLVFTQGNSEDLLRRLVAAAHARGKKVKLSVGGWTGSKYFSPAVSTEANRRTFAQNFVEVYDKFDLDGIDIDWEYPGTQGDASNIVSPDDSANYLEFLKLLRGLLPPDAVITAATQVWPFAGPNGRPMADVTQFAKYFDWILLMNYDIWGSSSTPGPNAPLDDGCKNSTQPLANAAAAVESWTNAGFPREKLVLGVPSYGYISQSQRTQLTGRADFVTVTNDDGGSSNGQVQFTGLIRQGALKKQGDQYVGAGGFKRNWDSCSSTPWLRSSSSGQIITYDDPESLKLKGEFVRQVGIRGINIFDAHGDTTSWELVDAVRSGLGI